MKIKYELENGEVFSDFEDAKKAEMKIVHNKLEEFVSAQTGLNAEENSALLNMFVENYTILESLLKQYGKAVEQTQSDLTVLGD